MTGPLLRSRIFFLALFSAAAPAFGREPEATFHVKDNWLEFEIRQDGLPCGNVEVQVIDDHGKSFASGEAGVDGQGAFPLPPGKSLILEIKTAGRKADHVFLRRSADGVEPSRVLLSYGLLPCCRTAASEKKFAPTPEKKVAGNPPFQPTHWLLFTAGLIGVVFALAQAIKRRPWGAANRWELGGVAALLAGGFALMWFFLPFHQAAAPPERDLARDAEKDLERRHYQPLSAPLDVLISEPKYRPIPTQSYPHLYEAPPFSLPDTNGKVWSLYDALRKGPVVVVFYYGYYCDHCVSQLFGLEKDLAKFRELGVEVVAISADPIELTRERFKQYGAFSFPVLCDTDNKVAAIYGTCVPPTKPGEEPERTHGTFIIHPENGIVWVNRGDGPFTENRTLLVEIARAQGRRAVPSDK